VPFDAAGNSADPWLDNTSAFLLRQDGTPYQGRDFLTLNTSQSFFGQDDIGFLNDKLILSLGLRYTQIQRDFTHYASEGGGAYYNIKQTYARPLPSVGIRYQFTDTQQVFVNRAENFKAPPDSVFYGLINGGSFNNQGKLTGYTLNTVNVGEELATNWDLGYRYTGKDVSFSGTLFYIDYRNRIASAFCRTGACTAPSPIPTAVSDKIYKPTPIRLKRLPARRFPTCQAIWRARRCNIAMGRGRAICRPSTPAHAIRRWSTMNRSTAIRWSVLMQAIVCLRRDGSATRPCVLMFTTCWIRITST